MNPKDPAHKKCLDLLAVAKVLVATSWPYLTTAVMRLSARWSAEVPTMGVDGHLRLYLNPNYVSTLSAPQLALLIAGHELQHVLGGHDRRLIGLSADEVGSDRPTSRSFANVCHDLAINSGLQSFIDSAAALRRANGHDPLPFKVPPDGVYPQAFVDRNGGPLPVGLISEEYASLLEHMRSPQCGRKPRGHSCGSGGGDQKQPWEEGEPDPSDPASGATGVEVEVIRNRVAQAAVEQESANRGTVPGSVRRWAEVRLAPVKTPWPQLLRRALKSGLSWARGRREWSWAQLSRYSPPNILLPAMVDPEPDVVVLIDTSGSMGPADYEPLFRNVYAIMRTLGFKKVPVMTCDARVHDVQYVSRVEDIKMVGGGGTDMGVGIERAVEMKKKMVVCFTDGCTPWPSEPKNTRVVIALTRDPHRSFPVPDWATVVVCKD